LSIVIAIIVFGIIVLIHEFGHFAAARKAGIFVEEFAIGMGPKLLKWKRGETLYSLRLVPIGGFCKMLGEDGESQDSRAFGNKPLSRRIIVIVAGALMNFVLAFVIFFVIMVLNGYAMPVVDGVVDGSAASEAGLQPGDRILSVNGTHISIYEDISLAMTTNKGRTIDVAVRRGAQDFTVTITPKLDDTDGTYKIGIYPDYRVGVFQKNADYASAGISGCLFNASYRIVFFVKATVHSIIWLITGQVPVSQLSGPIGIVGTINQEYKESIKTSIYDMVITMLSLCAFLSANLGAMNLLPLPALDGGRLVFLIIEGIRRKPVPPDKEGLVHMIGFAALIVLMVFIAFSDIRKMI